jgi:hypothetical protein
MLTNIHNAPAEGNFCDDNGKAIKPQIVAHYFRHMGYVNKGDRMANSYSICRQKLKWAKKLFFHLLELAILNSYILLSSCGGKKISHRDFRFILVRNMLAQAGYQRTVPRPLGRRASAAAQVNRWEASCSKHWPVPCATQVRCRVCERRRVLVKCRKCDVRLCVARSCFEDYHTNAQLWNSSGCADGPPSTKQGPQTQNVIKRNGILSGFFKFFVVHRYYEFLLQIFRRAEISLFHFPQTATCFITSSCFVRMI